MATEHSSRIRFYVFFENKKCDFLRFFEVAFKKNIKNIFQNSKFQTLLTFHYMASSLQLKNNACLMFIISICVNDNKSD